MLPILAQLIQSVLRCWRNVHCPRQNGTKARPRTDQTLKSLPRPPTSPPTDSLGPWAGIDPAMSKAAALAAAVVALRVRSRHVKAHVEAGRAPAAVLALAGIDPAVSKAGVLAGAVLMLAGIDPAMSKAVALAAARHRPLARFGAARSFLDRTKLAAGTESRCRGIRMLAAVRVRVRGFELRCDEPETLAAPLHEGAFRQRAIQPRTENYSPGTTGRSAGAQENPNIAACSKR
jgi:hypothetical protein